MSRLPSSDIRVSIVDDHPMFRMGVVRGLEDAGGIEVVAEGATAAEAISIFETHRPDISILDLSMPGGGHSAINAIRAISEEALIVVLTASDQEGDVFEAIRAGARGYVLKGVEVGDLIDVMHCILDGETYVSAGIASRVLAEMRDIQTTGGDDHRAVSCSRKLPDLTPREEQILSLVADGHSNKEVGRLLSLQEKSVKHVMTRVLKKLQARNRTEAAIQMREWQISSGKR